MSERDLGSAAWWEIRRAHNLKPTTYRCPLCGHQLPALSEHLLMLPEGSPKGRRHAHTECVLAARRAGRLPTRSEWRAAQRQARRAAGSKGATAGPEAVPESAPAGPEARTAGLAQLRARVAALWRRRT